MLVHNVELWLKDEMMSRIVGLSISNINKNISILRLTIADFFFYQIQEWINLKKKWRPTK